MASNGNLFEEDGNIEQQAESGHVLSQAEIAQALLVRKFPYRYILREQVAEGGMGIIFRVEDQDLERSTAIKLMYPNDTKPREHVTQFIQEARITSQLQHPNIIPVYDVGVLPGKDIDLPFYTMKLIDGQSLNDVLDKIKEGHQESIRDFPLPRLLEIFRKICDAVAFAHSRNIIHRDIKPDNIMVGEYGEVLLLDWGLARYCEQEHVGGPSYKNTHDHDAPKPTTATDGRVKGSPSYLSPEQAFGASSEINKQTDIFLLGATLFHILTLAPPYQGEDYRECIRKAMKGDFPHPHQTSYGKNAPNTIIEIMYKAMEIKKEFRYQTIQELIDSLDNYILGQTVSSYRFFEAGSTIFAEGDIGQETYALISGHAEVSRQIMGSSKVIAKISQGDVFGEMAAICKGARSATIKAIDNCEVLIISKNLLEDELRKLPPWLAKIVVSLSHRLFDQEKLSHPFHTTDCILATLKQIFFACTFIKPGESQNITLNYEVLIHEAALNIGLKHHSVKPIIDALTESELSNHVEDNYIVTDLDELRDLILYVDRKEMLERGHTLERSTKLDVNQIKEMQYIFDTLRNASQ